MIHKNGNISGPEGASVFHCPVNDYFQKMDSPTPAIINLEKMLR